MKSPAANLGGRRRDPSIDAAVLKATRELLEEIGFAATTVQEISHRSGVHPPAIYRRWRTRISLIEDAALSEMVEVPIEPSGDLRADLGRFLEAYESMLDQPATRAAIPGLLSSSQVNAEPFQERWKHLSLRPQLADILSAAAGQVDPDIEVDEIFDLVLAILLARVIVPPLAARRHPLERVVELVMRILRPEPPASADRRTLKSNPATSRRR